MLRISYEQQEKRCKWQPGRAQAGARSWRAREGVFGNDKKRARDERRSRETKLSFIYHVPGLDKRKKPSEMLNHQNSKLGSEQPPHLRTGGGRRCVARQRLDVNSGLLKSSGPSRLQGRERNKNAVAIARQGPPCRHATPNGSVQHVRTTNQISWFFHICECKSFFF